MKTKHFIYFGALALAFTLNSCKKDVLDLNKTLKFSTQTVEQQKQSIEQSGIDLANRMDGMQQTKAFIALQSFMTVSQNASMVKPFVAFKANLQKHNMKAMAELDKQLRVAYANPTQELWGEWTWSSTEQTFILKMPNLMTNKAIYKFPATDGSTTNNGVLTMTYAESNVYAPESEVYYPSSITLLLTIDGVEAIKADFSGTYKADGTPIKAIQTLAIEKFNWSAEVNNNDKTASEKFAFKYDKDVLLQTEATATGKFTGTEVNAITSSKTTNISDLVSSGAIYFQVMNIGVLGGFKDIKGLSDAMDALRKKYPNTSGKTPKAYYDEEVAVVNKYMKCYAYFVKENKKFADVEFYVVEVVDTHTFYDYNLQRDSTYSNTYYNVEPRFVLSDKSKVSIEDFVKTGFEDLIKKFESYGNLMN